MSLVENSVLTLLDSYAQQDHEDIGDFNSFNNGNKSTSVSNPWTVRSNKDGNFPELNSLLKNKTPLGQNISQSINRDVVISSSKNISSNVINKKSVFIVHQQPSGFKPDISKDKIAMNEIYGDIATTPYSFGNGLFGSKILTEWCYNNRWDPPKEPTDILYEGRMLGNKNKLNDWLLAIRQFGYVMVVEKSEAAKGRYKVVWERGSKKRKKLIADYDDTLWTRWFAYVNIHGFKVNVSQMEHSHGPGVIPPEKHFMGLLHTERLSKAKEDYQKERKFDPTHQIIPNDKILKVSNLTEIHQDPSKYDNLLLDDLNFSCSSANFQNDSSVSKVKSEKLNTKTIQIMTKNPNFDRFKQKLLGGALKPWSNIYLKISQLMNSSIKNKMNQYNKDNIFIRVDSGANWYATPINIGFTIQDWNSQWEDILKDISKVRGIDYSSL